MAEDINRADYGIQEEEMDFDRDKQMFKGKINDNYETILNEPVNKPLAEFEKEFHKIDTEVYERFSELNQYLSAFTRQLDENPVYENMEIVQMMREVLIRYKVWATALRQHAFLSKDKIREIHNIVKNYYIPAQELEMIKENLDVGITRKLDNELVIVFSKNKNISYKVGDRVRILREGDDKND